jgi:hypothetical protein
MFDLQETVHGSGGDQVWALLLHGVSRGCKTQEPELTCMSFSCAVNRFRKTPKCYACGASTGGMFNKVSISACVHEYR